MRRRRRRPGHGIDKTEGMRAAGAARNTTHTHAHPMSLACKPAALAVRESDSAEREGTLVSCHCPVAEGMLPLGHRPPGTESEEARKLVGSGGTP
eukprot:gene19700-biopygen8497